MFQKLKELDPFFEEIFNSFYSDLLKREHLSKFFKSDKHIKSIVKKQRKIIWDSLSYGDEYLREEYFKLADFHINTIGLHFADYIESFNFLKDKFVSILIREGRLEEFFVIVNDYFEKIRQYTAERYLLDSVRSAFQELPSAIFKEDFKALILHDKHFERGLEAMLSKNADLIREIYSEPCYMDRWFLSLEAEMMISDINTFERLKKLHEDECALCSDIGYYIHEGLYLQAYIEFKALLHVNSLFSKAMTVVYSSFIQNKEKIFFDFIRKAEEDDIIFLTSIEDLSVPHDLNKEGSTDFMFKETMKGLENAFVGKNYVYIVDDVIIGLVRGIKQQEINSLTEGIKTQIKALSDKKINANTVLIRIKEIFGSEPDLLIGIRYKTFRQVMSLTKDKDRKAYLITEEETLQKIKDIFKLNAQEVKYSRMVFEEGRLDVFFQPIVGLRSNKIYNVEALVRVKESDSFVSNGKYISAYMFIEALHEKNLVPELDMIVLEKVLEYAGRIKKITNKLSVNVSPLSMKIPVYQKSTEKAIKRLKEEGISLYFEITEQALLENTDIIKYLSLHHGIKFVIDDFGIGYSSLKTIAELAEAEAISHLKIDGSLTERVLDSEEMYKIVKATSQMAKSLGLKTVAEFVENYRIRDVLIELEINYGQGFYFSPALHIDELVAKYQSLNMPKI